MHCGSVYFKAFAVDSLCGDNNSLGNLHPNDGNLDLQNPVSIESSLSLFDDKAEFAGFEIFGGPIVNNRNHRRSELLLFFQCEASQKIPRH